jgi:hypothetical protein
MAENFQSDSPLVTFLESLVLVVGNIHYSTSKTHRNPLKVVCYFFDNVFFE